MPRSDATLRIDANTRAAEAQIAGLQGGLGALGKAAAGFAAVWGGIEIARAGYEMARVASQFDDARKIFERMGGDLESLRRATNGMVDDFSLIKQANLARQMGIDQKAVEQFARIAEAAARSTGQSFDYLLESIVSGTARQEKEILDNLGIIVSAKKEYGEYAAALGKTANALTDAEKRQAFTNAVMREGQKLIDDAGDAASSSSAQYAKLEAAARNLKLQIGDALAPAVGDLARAATDAAEAMAQLLGELTGSNQARLEQTQREIAMLDRLFDLESQRDEILAARDVIAKSKLGFLLSEEDAELTNLEMRIKALRSALKSMGVDLGGAEPAAAPASPSKPKSSAGPSITFGEPTIRTDVPSVDDVASPSGRDFIAEREEMARIEAEYDQMDFERQLEIDMRLHAEQAMLKEQARAEEARLEEEARAEQLALAERAARAEMQMRVAYAQEAASISVGFFQTGFAHFLDLVEAGVTGAEIDFARVTGAIIRDIGMQVMGISSKYIIEGAGMMASGNVPMGGATLAVGLAGMAAGAGMATTGTVVGTMDLGGLNRSSAAGAASGGAIGAGGPSRAVGVGTTTATAGQASHITIVNNAPVYDLNQATRHMAKVRRRSAELLVEATV